MPSTVHIEERRGRAPGRTRPAHTTDPNPDPAPPVARRPSGVPARGEAALAASAPRPVALATLHAATSSYGARGRVLDESSPPSTLRTATRLLRSGEEKVNAAAAPSRQSERVHASPVAVGERAACVNPRTVRNPHSLISSRRQANGLLGSPPKPSPPTALAAAACARSSAPSVFSSISSREAPPGSTRLSDHP